MVMFEDFTELDADFGNCYRKLPVIWVRVMGGEEIVGEV
jgi:hypothetical protein